MRIFSMAAALFLVPWAAGAQDDVFPLDGIVVTASPTPRSAESIATHVTVLSGEELRADGITSVSEALRHEASLVVVRSGSFGGPTSLFLRGAESDHTLVLIDGVQVNQAGGSFDFSTLTTDNVERIEIVRGPASALYGSDAMAGVIHIVTRVGRGAPRLGATMETTSYSEERDELVDGVRWSADIAGGSDSFGYSASVSRESTDGILAFNNRFLNTVASGSARLAPDDRTRVALNLRITDRRFHFPTDGSGQVVDRNSFGFGDETTVGLTASRRLTSVLGLETLLTVNEVDSGTDDAPDDASDPDGFKSLDHFRRAAAEVRANVTVVDATLTLGGEVERERQRSFSEFLSSFGPSYGRSESDRRNLAAFAHVTGGRGIVAYNAGTRVEDNERFGTSVTWQGGVSTHLPNRPETRLRASVGTAIKEPNFFENFATGFVVGNPDLDPEESLSWEVGVEHELVEDVRVRATWFDQRLTDLIQYTAAPPNPGDPNYFNVAAAETRGIEIDARAALGAVDVGAAYTWLDTEVTDSGFDSGPDAAFVGGEALLRRPTHTFGLHAAGRVADRGRVHSRVSFVGSRADRTFDPDTFAPTRLELDGYVLWTLGAEWSVVEGTNRRPSLAVSVRAENLLDESYEEAYGFRSPGRQIYFGVSMGLGGSD